MRDGAGHTRIAHIAMQRREEGPPSYQEHTGSDCRAALDAQPENRQDIELKVQLEKHGEKACL